MSHPTWVRGLKLVHTTNCIRENMSHPTWVRGLKLIIISKRKKYTSRTLRGCVD